MRKTRAAEIREYNEARQRLVAALGWEPEDQTCERRRYAASTGELQTYVAEMFGAAYAAGLRAGVTAFRVGG